MIISFKKSINFLVSQFATRLTAIHDTVDFSLMKMRQNIKIIFFKGIKFLTMGNAVMDDAAIPLNASSIVSPIRAKEVTLSARRRALETNRFVTLGAMGIGPQKPEIPERFGDIKKKTDTLSKLSVLFRRGRPIRGHDEES